MGNWLKLHRCLLNKPIWTNSTDEQKIIFITLLLMTNWQEQSWDYYGQKIMLQPGQFATTIPKIQAACQSKDITPRKIRSALERFEKLGFLTDKPTGKSTKSGRVITIENWGIYQGSEDEDVRENDRQNDKEMSERCPRDVRHIKKEVKEVLDIPYAKIKDLFNEVCKSQPSIIDLDQRRKTSLKARWKDLGCSLEKVEWFFKRIEESDFLAGRVCGKGGKPFVPGFDWVMKKANFQKIIEGNYTDKKQVIVSNRPLSMPEMQKAALELARQKEGRK